MSRKDFAGIMVTWYRLVTQYTKRALTKQSDRLPAIAGVASLLGAATGYSYLAGIWKEDMQGLLWFTVSKNQRSHAYLAPSWSWASTTDRVSFRFESETAITSPEDAQILDSKIANVGVDRFGQVKTGYIKLWAIGMDLQYDPVLGKLGTRKPPKLLEDGIMQSEDPQLLSRYEYQPAFGKAVLDDDNSAVPNDKNADVQGRRLCIAIFIQRRIPSNITAYKGTLLDEEAKKIHSAIYCLILQQCNAAEWKRIGIVTTYDGPLRDFIERGLGEWSSPREFTMV
jgi:hypothetical protein